MNIERITVTPMMGKSINVPNKIEKIQVVFILNKNSKLELLQFA
jgi:hypothetical protein